MVVHHRSNDGMVMYHRWSLICSYKTNDSKCLKEHSLRDHLKKHSGEKPNKCNQCDYAFIRASTLRDHLKKHSVETNGTSVIMHPLGQTVWGDIWEHRVEKKPRSATSANMPVMIQAAWGDIWRHTVEKSQTNATNVTLHLLGQPVWGTIWRNTASVWGQLEHICQYMNVYNICLCMT